MILITKEFIDLIPKTINSNGCWISNYIPETCHNIRIKINGNRFLLSRLVMCLWSDINYDDKKIIARHKCNNGSCFNPEHIIPGSDSDNTYDSIKAGTHYNASKEVCPKCKFPYRKHKQINRNTSKTTWTRYCANCYNERRRKK
jgi:hypothetical protein